MIKYIFIDLDNTILDFYAAEEEVLGPALAACGITPTPQVISTYQRINLAQWALLEQGEVSIDEVGVRRFALLIDSLGICADAHVLSDTYERMLLWAQQHRFALRGDCCERYVLDIYSTPRQENYVTEVLLPVAEDTEDFARLNRWKQGR